jgi:fatty acid desaturase
MSDETEQHDDQRRAWQAPHGADLGDRGADRRRARPFSSEVAYQRARAILASKIAGRIAGLAALAAALVFFFLMALVVGLLLALAPLLGTWQALGIVVLALLLGMAVAAWAVRGHGGG